MKNIRARAGKSFGVAIVVGGVYQIRCHLSSAIYIGQSQDISRRFYCHRLSLKKGNHPIKFLQAEFDKSGMKGLCFDILEVENDEAQRAFAEYEWIKQLSAVGAILLNGPCTLEYSVPTKSRHLVN